MRYSNGNYEAFAHPRKPADADKKSAHIVGGGLAGLATAVFLVRDAQVPGSQIHIYEELPIPGGSLDGDNRPNVGFVIRGGREMENHFETMWDMYRSIPSLEIEGASTWMSFIGWTKMIQIHLTHASFTSAISAPQLMASTNLMTRRWNS